MAFHAIRAGEGDVFVSAGVETVSRFAKGNSDALPDTRNPVFADAGDRTAHIAEQGAADWHDPREDEHLPDVYLAMGQTAENLAQLKGVTREDMDEFGVRSQNLAEKAIADGFWAREITPVTLPDGTVVSTDDGPRPGVDARGGQPAQAGVPARRPGHRRQLLPAQRRRGRGGHHVRHARPRELGITPLARIVSTGVSGAVPRDHGSGPGRGVASRRWPGPA